MSTEELRRVLGFPGVLEFADWRGTPLAIDVNTGRLYILRSDNVVVDCMLLSADGVWDDLRFPVQGINPAGAANAPAVETDLALFPGTLLFSGSQDNYIAGVAQMPHSWQDGTAIRPHIHWTKTTNVAGAVGWQFRYRKAKAGALFPAWSAWIPGVSTVAVNGAEATADTHYVTTFGNVAMTGDTDSTMISWQISRRGTSDAYNSNARLLEFDIHFQINCNGSIAEFPV